MTANLFENCCNYCMRSITTVTSIASWGSLTKIYSNLLCITGYPLKQLIWTWNWWHSVFCPTRPGKDIFSSLSSFGRWNTWVLCCSCSNGTLSWNACPCDELTQTLGMGCTNNNIHWLRESFLLKSRSSALVRIQGLFRGRKAQSRMCSNKFEEDFPRYHEFSRLDFSSSSRPHSAHRMRLVMHIPSRCLVILSRTTQPLWPMQRQMSTSWRNSSTNTMQYSCWWIQGRVDSFPPSLGLQRERWFDLLRVLLIFLCIIQIILNAALGFDTYLVMHHGARASSLSTGHNGKPHQKLGCYYCNDIVVPADVSPQPFCLLFDR